MRRRKNVNFRIATVVPVVLLWSLASAFSKEVVESVRLKPLQERQQSRDEEQKYFFKSQSNVFDSTSALSKSHQQVSSKNYEIHSFLGIKNSWLGKKVVRDEVKSVWRESEKQFEKKFFPSAIFSHPSRIVTGRAFSIHSYPTKRFYPEAKAQGGLDHDIQEALKKAKNPQEVKALLEQEK